VSRQQSVCATARAKARRVHSKRTPAHALALSLRRLTPYDWTTSQTPQAQETGCVRSHPMIAICMRARSNSQAIGSLLRTPKSSAQLGDLEYSCMRRSSTAECKYRARCSFMAKAAWNKPALQHVWGTSPSPRRCICLLWHPEITTRPSGTGNQERATYRN